MTVAAASRPGPKRSGTALRPVRLGPSDLSRIVALHARLHAAAAEPGLFARETAAFFMHHLGPGGQIIGAQTVDGDLVCYAVLGLPDPDAEENFGHDIGLDRRQRAALCHLDGSGVAPDRQGAGLQRWLTRARLRRAARLGRKTALSTAAPHNHRSIANLTACGLRVVAVVAKYGAVRLVLRGDTRLAAPAPPSPSAAPRVALDGRVDDHRRLLGRGWVGMQVASDGGRPVLIYARPDDAAP